MLRMEETTSQVVKAMTKLYVFLIGFFSIWGISYTFGWEFLGHPRGVAIVLVSVCAIVWSVKGSINLRGIKGETVSTLALILMYVILIGSFLNPEVAKYSPILLMVTLTVLIVSMLAWK